MHSIFISLFITGITLGAVTVHRWRRQCIIIVISAHMTSVVIFQVLARGFQVRWMAVQEEHYRRSKNSTSYYKFFIILILFSHKSCIVENIIYFLSWNFIRFTINYLQ